VHRLPGPAGQAALLGEHRPDPLTRAQANDPVRAGGDTELGQFIGDEPVAEGEVVVVDV
jgi:hypothetical protein